MHISQSCFLQYLHRVNHIIHVAHLKQAAAAELATMAAAAPAALLAALAPRLLSGGVDASDGPAIQVCRLLLREFTQS